MDQISRMFAERFARWSITLPEANLKFRSSGHLTQSGWTIQFCFGREENGDYLDYYASHRMTSDEHKRLYADGSITGLEALNSFHVLSDDPEEAKRIESEFHIRNHKISEELLAKGFNLFTINMVLSAGLAGSQSTRGST